MTLYQGSPIIGHGGSPSKRRWILFPAVTVVCWLTLQKACVLTPDISPARSFADTAMPAAQLELVDTVLESETAPPLHKGIAQWERWAQLLDHGCLSATGEWRWTLTERGLHSWQ